MSQTIRFFVRLLAATVTLSLLSVGFSVAPPAQATATTCDTSPTLGQTVVCGYAGDGHLTFDVPRIGPFVATQVIVQLRSAGGGGGGANSVYDGNQGGYGLIVTARVDLQPQSATVTVDLGAPGMGGAGASGSNPGDNGNRGGTSRLSVEGINGGAPLFVVTGGRGGGGATADGDGAPARDNDDIQCPAMYVVTDCDVNGANSMGVMPGLPGWSYHSGDGGDGSDGAPGLVSLTFMFGSSSGSDCGDYTLDEAFEGSGTAGDPFRIENEADLLRMSGCTFAGKYLKQTANITTTDPQPVKDGSYWFRPFDSNHMGAYSFRGTYNGNHKTITFDLRTTSCRPPTDPFDPDPEVVACGVFRQTEAAEITDLTIDGSNAGGEGRPGVVPELEGWLTPWDAMRPGPDFSPRSPLSRPPTFSTFSGITVLGDIAAVSGGIVGSAFGTHIYDSSVTGKFRGNLSGGIVGRNSQDVTVRRSHTSIDPNGSLFSGGIVGPYSLGVTVSDVYSTGDVPLGGGGIVGAFSVDAQVQNCFATGNIPNSEDGFYDDGGIPYASGGIIGAKASVSSLDNRIIVRNCYTTGSIGEGAGGIIGNIALDSAVSVFTSYTSGGSSNFPMGVIFADNNYINSTSEEYFGEGNDSDANASPSEGFQLSKFIEFVATGERAWNDGAYTGATWALCASVHPTLPYLTALFSTDPCVVASSTPTTPVVEQVPDWNSPPPGQPLVVTVGQATMTVGGATISISRTPGSTGAGFRLSGGGVVVEVTPPPQGFSSGGTSTVTISGFSPSSQVGGFLYSSPVSVGVLSVRSDGVARGTITIPTSVPSGSHTFQVTGWTRSGETIILSAGISVLPQIRSLQKSVSFATGIPRLNQAGRNAVTRLVAESSALAGPTRTVISYSSVGNPSQVRLEKRRAATLMKLLQSSEMPGTFEMKPVGRSQSFAPNSLRVTATG